VVLRGVPFDWLEMVSRYDSWWVRADGGHYPAAEGATEDAYGVQDKQWFCYIAMTMQQIRVGLWAAEILRLRPHGRPPIG
jgi:hypothetical protein